MIERGSVVQLKSGGPLMTVTCIDTNHSDTLITCRWFDVSHHLHWNDFRASQLTLTGAINERTN